MSGTGIGKGILGFAGDGARVILDTFGSLSAVKPTLHQSVPHSHSNNDADGNRNLTGNEVRHYVGIDKVGSAHGVGRTRTQVQAAGRTDHGCGGSATHAQLNEQRIDRSHQQQAEADGRVNEQSHTLAYNVGKAQQDIRRMNGRQRTHAQLHESCRSANFVHIERETADGHDVEAQTADTALRKIRKGLRKVKTKEVGSGLGRNRRVAHEGTDQQQNEGQHQKNDGRVVIFDNEVREQHNGQQRNNDAKHSTSPLVIVVMSCSTSEGTVCADFVKLKLRILVVSCCL